MKNIITLIGISLVMSLGGLKAQKLDYDNTSKWFWGLNVGATWQNTDVANRTSGAWGFTLGRAFNYNYGKRLSFDIRGRYLGGYWYGQDTDSTQFLYANQALSQDPTNYKDSLGYMVNNFRTETHEADLELVMHLNRVREQTGWDPYLFGGVGFSWYNPKGDLLNRTEAGSSLYDYNNLSSLSKEALDATLDGYYETSLDHQDADFTLGDDPDGFKVGFMPSVGVGIGYYFGKRFSLGLEHKTTFTLADDFDGYIDPSKRTKNDIYHYTSAYFRYHFKLRTPSVPTTTTGTTGNNNFTNCQTPLIRFNSPDNGTTLNQANLNFTANVAHIKARESVKITINGVQSTNFVFNTSNNRLDGSAYLQFGQNTIVITATNACGTTSETLLVNYELDCDPPVVVFRNPSISGASVKSNTFNISADIDNIANNGSLTFKVNGVIMTNYRLNGNHLDANIPLMAGANTIEIIAANQCGTDTEVTVVNYEQECDLPIIQMIRPTSEITVNSSNYTLEGKIQKIVNANQVQVLVNGVAQSQGLFYNNSKIYKKEFVLNTGRNVIEIKATNDCGSAVQVVYINYVPQVITPVEEEKITICHYPPGNNGNPQTIEIPLSAWPAHQAHGDKLGPCPEVETPVEEEKISICTRKGNTWETIEINATEWPRYQRQGAKLGPCDEEEKPGKPSVGGNKTIGGGGPSIGNGQTESPGKEEAERKAREEAQKKAEELARQKAEVERKAKEEAQRKAEELARQKAEAERKAKEEAQRKAEELARQKAEQERIRKQQEAAQKQKAEAERKAKEEAKRKAEAEKKAKEEENKKEEDPKETPTTKGKSGGKN